MQAIKRSPKLPATHPGITFGEKILKRNNITVKQAAVKLNVTRAHLSRFVNGKVGVTADFAVKLEKASGVSAGFWLNKQNKFDLFHSYQKELNCEPLYEFKTAVNS